MKVLITGGQGFIGQALIHELQRIDVEIISLDTKNQNSSLIQNNGVHYVNGSVLDTFLLGQLLKGCDICFHLAGILGVENAENRPLETLLVNAEGSKSVCQAAIMAGCQRVVLSSSSEVYGDVCNPEHGYSETSPLNPKSGYAISKLCAEEFFNGFGKEYGLDARIMRFFNVYGPLQDPKFVMPKFAQAIASGSPLTIYGSGSQTRSFCYVGDAASAITQFGLADHMKSQTLIIGNDKEPISMLDLAQKFISIAGRGNINQVRFCESDRTEAREIYHRSLNVSKLRNELGFTPSICLEDGINMMLTKYC